MVYHGHSFWQWKLVQSSFLLKGVGLRQPQWARPKVAKLCDKLL